MIQLLKKIHTQLNKFTDASNVLINLTKDALVERTRLSEKTLASVRTIVRIYTFSKGPLLRVLLKHPLGKVY